MVNSPPFFRVLTEGTFSLSVSELEGCQKRTITKIDSKFSQKIGNEKSGTSYEMKGPMSQIIIIIIVKNHKSLKSRLM